ncbi:MAG: hypothetical protein QOC98_1787 [Frankiaceae bacterium]|nr:hypothetical protein [Frankiaceae bacterium]
MDRDPDRDRDRDQSAAPPAPTELTDLFPRYWNALASVDRSAAIGVAFEAVEIGHDVSSVLTGLVARGQIEVGRCWAANEWNIAQEHAATSVSEEVVAALGTRLHTRPHRGIVVVSCVEGEWHALPAKLLAETLRGAGWDVRYLGASLPAAHLSQFIHDVGPDVVALSCSIPTSLPRARGMIEAARDGGVPVIAGGRGFGSDASRAQRLGANGWAPTAPTAARMLGSPDWPRFTERAPALDQVDDAAEVLWAATGRLTQLAETELRRHFAGMADYDEQAVARTREDLAHIVGFLAAALYVDESALFEEFVAWLDALLVAREVPEEVVRIGLDALAAVLPPLPRAVAFLETVRHGPWSSPVPAAAG